MKFKTISSIAIFLMLFSTSAYAAEKRCGWFHNPTPSNAWLIDRDDEWIVGYQGGHQAEGDWPDFSDKQWVKTNVHYGYGCACITVELDKKTKYVKRILKAEALDLSVCERDKSLNKN